MTIPQTEPDPRAALALLEFYRDAGCDEAIGEVALDRTSLPPPRRAAPASRPAQGPAQSPASGPLQNPKIAAAAPDRAKAPAQPAPQLRAPPTPQLLAASAARTAAEAAAAACGTVADLARAVAEFDGCALRRTATKTVFARGNPTAPLMLIGEAPGREEDEKGLPFVGESGQLLDRMLAAIGRPEGSYYISNVVFWRPPGNRDPSPEELQICRPFVERHIALVQPRILVLVGRHATGSLLNSSQGIKRLHGKWHSFSSGTDEIPTLPMFHPAFLLREPWMKREAWRDLLTLSEKLREMGL